MPRVSCILAALSLAVFLSVSVQAQKQWLEASSEHFLLFTDTSEVKAQRLLTDLESRVSAMSDALGGLRPMQFPIEIFMFSKYEDFTDAAPGGAAAKFDRSVYLVKGEDRVFIISRDKTPEAFDDEIGHALGHVFFEHQVMWRPFWLDEGAAEYFRRAGRPPNKKSISKSDAFALEDLLRIVPSATYDDDGQAQRAAPRPTFNVAPILKTASSSDNNETDDNGPDIFRLESYRLVRFLLEEKPDALRAYVKALGKEAGADAKLNIDTEEFGAAFSGYVETALEAPSVMGAAHTDPADPANLAIHRGDMMFAAGHTSDASRYYSADSNEARAARAILNGASRSTGEGFSSLSRAAKDLPNFGLVQYHFGALVASDKKDLPAQIDALGRAINLLPRFGPPYAELARVESLAGMNGDVVALVNRALELSPERADHFYEIEADAYVAQGKYDDAFRTIKIAEALPHADRKASEAYNAKIAALTKKVENLRQTAETQSVDRLRAEVAAKVAAIEPPKKPEPPPPPVPEGRVTYDIEARTTLQVVEQVYPDYPEELRRNGASGKISLRVDIGADGAVKNAVVTESQLPGLNAAALEAAKKWTFKLPAGARPAVTSIRLVFSFVLS